AYTMRDRLLARMIGSGEYYREQGAKTVAYMSAEYLLGPHLANNILNLKLGDRVREAISALGLDLDTILDAEEEPGLGNGGLGRLAACSWRRWRRSRFRRLATVSGTSTASSNSRSRMVGRSKSPTPGSET